MLIDFADVTPSSESELSLFSRSRNDTSKSSSSGPSVQAGRKRKHVLPSVSSRASTSNSRSVVYVVLSIIVYW